MMDLSPRLRLIFSTVLVSSCEAISSPRSPPPLPVIQGILVVGQQEQTISVTWSVPADSSFTFEGPGRAVAPSEVDLRIGELGGSAAQLSSADEALGTFRAILPVRPSADYTLDGTVAGRHVSATLRTPGLFSITLPAGDTVRLSAADRNRQVPYLWHAPGAVGFSTRDFLAFVEATSDSTGRILFLLGAPDTTRLDLFAYERHAADFLLPQATAPRSGNIQGALGVLGAMSTARRVFIWR